LKARVKAFLFIYFMTTLLLVSCTGTTTPAIQPEPTLTSTQKQPVPVLPTLIPTKAPQEPANVWKDAILPASFSDAVKIDSSIQKAVDQNSASYSIRLVESGNASQALATADWLYVLVEPFDQILDDVKIEDLNHLWKGESGGALDGKHLYLTSQTKALFEQIWGAQQGDGVIVGDQSGLVDQTWADPASLALVEFGDLQPKWKVLTLDGLSVLDKQLDVDQYALTVKFGLFENNKTAAKVSNPTELMALPKTNRDIDKMTVLVMTGVTALVRMTAQKMEEKGVTYPGEAIRDWLKNADITHISNEVSFNPKCPPPNGLKMTLHFCSDPKYIELLEYVGADVIDLTGNHQNDYGRDALTFSLDLYKQHGMKTFAAGNDANEARQPITMEDHGNKIAFIGCNPAGPELDWATDTKAGSAKCDMPYMESQIQQLTSQGYQVIADFQYFENYGYTPSVGQYRDFRAVSKAGAVIVQGDQAHFTQIMEFNGEQFIHYGLGNLFFDQMHVDVNGTTITQTRREVIDRHIFYNGKYISTQLLTAMLEDYAQPMPMTTDERTQLLSDLFKASGWQK
jgi:hypothetical protein